jgi:type I restriction enzyme M protein
VSLDITWLRDESLEDVDNLPPPDIIAQEIIEDLEAGLTEFSGNRRITRAKRESRRHDG